jgi:hypothetical protein
MYETSRMGFEIPKLNASLPASLSCLQQALLTAGTVDLDPIRAMGSEYFTSAMSDSAVTRKHSKKQAVLAPGEGPGGSLSSHQAEHLRQSERCNYKHQYVLLVPTPSLQKQSHRRIEKFAQARSSEIVETTASETTSQFGHIHGCQFSFQNPTACSGSPKSQPLHRRRYLSTSHIYWPPTQSSCTTNTPTASPDPLTTTQQRPPSSPQSHSSPSPTHPPHHSATPPETP